MMGRLIEAQSEEFSFMMAMMLYVGSIYTNNIDIAQLRDRAYDMASGPLETTVWTVQALLCICIAALGEGHVDLCGSWFQKALEMALELGLQNKSFADAEDDPVLAESYRRTYWALYLHGSLRTVREHLGHFQLYCTTATTELPCEEWEYQAEDIPTPVSLKEFRQQGTSRDYSSWAYLADLIRISGESVVPLLNVGFGADSEAIDRADSRIVSWLLQLPQWKKELVDPEGAVDMILYHALGIAHGLRIRIQLHLHGAGVQFRVPDLVRNGPIFQPSSLFPSSVTTKSHPWMYGSTALQGSLALVGLFKSHLPPEKFSPSCTLGLERAAMPLLDAYLYGGIKTPTLRDKIMLLANVLRKAGEFWPIAKAVSEDIIEALEGATHVEEQEGGEQEGGEHGGWERTIDWLVPSKLYEEEGFNFVPPMSIEQMNTWGGQMLRPGPGPVKIEGQWM
ncbi:hypothetical protein G7Z17_g13005 [Cylindrodendrum hubeiense]|uniref:Xylanolytic transcriptional activator regulatory domain-containing protein n=1 Tax=Cylindrodendrum hubeiense TaxID=595255 RepID=A0A9P5GWM4_9HYPO|nr:hypothetical protein G7Z17_g13005 [Cylindrodendrum hubeiense]